MSGTNLFIYAVILCCSFGTLCGAYGRYSTRMHPSVIADLYKRSPVCLINHLAQKNHIPYKYELIKDAPKSDINSSTTLKPHYYECCLQLGTETYSASATTQAKAKEKVSREAYDRTDYPRPTLKERTCVESASRTIVAVLYEFALINRTEIRRNETELPGKPPRFRVELTMNELSATGEGRSKKAAKNEAAAKLLTKLDKEHVLHEITKKFNDAKYIEMRPVERLNRILSARAEPLAKYTLKEEISDIEGIMYLSQVETYSGDAIGTGRSLDASRDDAANNLLQIMGFKGSLRNHSCDSDDINRAR